jgi:protein-S-isoprenylcysteine O-methyltransferase Ste14
VGDSADARVLNVEGNPGNQAAATTHPGLFKSRPGFSNALSNICLAALFLVALVPGVHHYASSVADIVWAIGAALMGLLSLVRVPPKTVTVNIRTISATAGMMIVPTLLEPSTPTVGLLYTIGVAVEIVGVIFTQVARISLGRRFGLLPANRGIVSSGPFRLVRHPIYSGWLVLTIGYVLIYPSTRNLLVVAAVIPFLIWRIGQEETLLCEDQGYRSYTERVHYRLLPYIL